jgi:hypothetical protein
VDAGRALVRATWVLVVATFLLFLTTLAQAHLAYYTIVHPKL